MMNAPCTRYRWNCPLPTLWAVVALLLIAESMDAQQAKPPPVKLPQLGDHTFIVNELVGDPFIKTYVRTSLGVGKVTDFEVPLAIIEGDTILGFKGDLLLAILEFEYQQAVKDWIASWGSVRLAGRLGTGVQSLLASGVTANVEFELGWLFKLYKSERAMLSGSLSINNGDVTGINVLQFVEDVIRGEEALLVQTTPSLHGGGGLRFAYGVSDLLGFYLIANLGYGESVDRQAASGWFVDTGGIASINIANRTSVPLGWGIGFRTASVPVTTDLDNDVTEALVRMAYTGTDDFSISLDLNYGDVPVIGLDPGPGTALATVRLNMRYYF
jgi:hypothetical protein